MCSGYLSYLLFASAAVEPLQSVCCLPTLSALPKTDLMLELLKCHGFRCKNRCKVTLTLATAPKLSLLIATSALDKGVYLVRIVAFLIDRWFGSASCMNYFICSGVRS